MASASLPHSSVSAKSPAAQEYEVGAGAGDVKNHVVVDVVLRVMLLVTSLIGIIVMVTSKQTKLIPVAPGLTIPVTAKFSQSPAFIYYTVALSVACFYSIITGVLSVTALLMSKRSSTKWVFRFLILDVLLLGIMGSAIGAAGAIAYIGFKGNKHTQWKEVCNMYGSFCGRIAASLTLSVLPSFALLLLIWLSVYMLSKKIVR
ncbi:hypothetical protein QVD17_27023 [Tagetes erecta]|uniref:CASP-like protein n=1 Tax=Tagetes erecta TaxID=13708 RepID=A0AAD8NR99_TARER|nr:hypothetical protein QVD17_27023 [Tagetes erecta]